MATMEGAISDQARAARRAPSEKDRGDRDDSPKLRFRSIFISDIHLGTPGCQAGHLLDFLRHTESTYLYLVGDIIDGWQLKRRWYWHQSHNDVIQKVLRKARKGTRVTYIAGNHDEAMRDFLDLDFGGIDIRAEAEHRTADGRRLLVIHGDLFDAVVQGAKWLAHLGDWLYMLTLKLNRWFNQAMVLPSVTTTPFTCGVQASVTSRMRNGFSRECDGVLGARADRSPIDDAQLAALELDEGRRNGTLLR